MILYQNKDLEFRFKDFILNLPFLILVEFAVSFGHIRILRFLVENHPSIDCKALAYAVNYKQKEMAQFPIQMAQM